MFPLAKLERHSDINYYEVADIIRTTYDNIIEY